MEGGAVNGRIRALLPSCNIAEIGAPISESARTGEFLRPLPNWSSALRGSAPRPANQQLKTSAHWLNIKPNEAAESLSRTFRTPQLTRIRIVIALMVAVIADGLQFFLGPLAWAFVDQTIDVMAMGLTSWVVGFHWLLLPTFALELIPVLDALPTWTACVIAVIAIRSGNNESLALYRTLQASLSAGTKIVARPTTIHRARSGSRIAGRGHEQTDPDGRAGNPCCVVAIARVPQHIHVEVVRLASGFYS